MRRFFSRSSIYRGNRPWPWALPLWLNYITSPRSRQGWGLVGFRPVFTFFAICVIIFSDKKAGRSTPKGGGRMTFSDACNLLLVVLGAINLGIVIATVKRK